MTKRLFDIQFEILNTELNHITEGRSGNLGLTTKPVEMRSF